MKYSPNSKVNILFFTILFNVHMLSQNKTTQILGIWQLTEYYSQFDNKIKTGNEPCPHFLNMEIRNKGRLTFIFKSANDSISFPGKYKFKKNNFLVSNRIWEVLYLDSMQYCISSGLRMELRMILRQVNSVKIDNDKLTFIFPDRDTGELRNMTFKKIN